MKLKDVRSCVRRKYGLSHDEPSPAQIELWRRGVRRLLHTHNSEEAGTTVAKTVFDSYGSIESKAARPVLDILKDLDTNPDDAFWQAEFDMVANTWQAWKVKGTELWLSGNHLAKVYATRAQGEALRKVKVFGPMQMLRGMALECWFKAIAVNQGKLKATQGKLEFSPRLHGRHDLPKLAKWVDFEVNDEQRSILARLAYYIQLGRYPVPWVWNDITKAFSKKPRFEPWRDSDESQLQDLAERLQKATHPSFMKKFLEK